MVTWQFIISFISSSLLSSVRRGGGLTTPSKQNSTDDMEWDEYETGEVTLPPPSGQQSWQYSSVEARVGSAFSPSPTL